MTALTRAAPPRAAGAPKRSRASIVLYVLLTLGLIAMVAPFVWMVLGSFKPQAEFLRLPPTWLPEQPTTDNYQRLIDQLDMPRFFFNSIGGRRRGHGGQPDLLADARATPWPSSASSARGRSWASSSRR